jgi:GNAT superfamily N-acetyltransferase
MGIQVERVEFAEIAPYREEFRAEARCQIVRDSILPRGLANPYLIVKEGEVAGYGGVWNEHFPDRIMEFFVAEKWRPSASDLFLALVEASLATEAEAQTNLDLQHRMVLTHATNLNVENLLFGEGPETSLNLPNARFRARLPTDSGPGGEWVVEQDGKPVGFGGLLHHYNPPFADLFLEVVSSARGEGIGSLLVQELRRVCRKAGKTPAARCNPEKHASRKALERGGLIVVGQIVAGSISGRPKTDTV